MGSHWAAWASWDQHTLVSSCINWNSLCCSLPRNPRLTGNPSSPFSINHSHWQWSHWQIVLLFTRSTPQDLFLRHFDPRAYEWQPGKGWAPSWACMGLGEAGGLLNGRIPWASRWNMGAINPESFFLCWHLFLLLLLSSARHGIIACESDIIHCLLCTMPCLNWETMSSSVCLLLETFLSHWGSWTLSFQSAQSTDLFLFQFLTL